MRRAVSVIEIVRADITTLNVDAIVNAANSALSGGGGVDGAIHRAAGPALAEAARKHGRCPPGNAVLTPAFNLSAKFVIHAVGPVWTDGEHGEAACLDSTYRAAFTLALKERTIRTIAFPSISTGAYRFPRERAARIALSTMLEHEPRFEKIIACLFDAPDVVIYQRARVDAVSSAFVAFVARVADGVCTSEEWDRFAVQHYPDDRIEAARAELVRTSVQESTPIWPEVPESVRQTAVSLLKRLA